MTEIENKRLIMQSTIYNEDKILNTITVYEDSDKKIYVHNTNGIKQNICPYLRYCGGLFYCLEYADNAQKIDCSQWDIKYNNNLCIIRNPQYKDCSELGENAEHYKDCKYYIVREQFNNNLNLTEEKEEIRNILK